MNNFKEVKIEDSTSDETKIGSADIVIAEDISNNESSEVVENFNKEERGIMERLRGKAASLGKIFLLLSAFSSTTSAKEHPNLNTETKIETLSQEVIFKNSAFELVASPDKKSKNDPEIAEKIGLIHVEAVCDGELKKINLTKEDLEKNPLLEVNGFLKGVMVLGDEVETKINGEKARKLNSKKSKEGEIKIEKPWLFLNDIVKLDEFSNSLGDSRADSVFIHDYLTNIGAGQDKIPGTAYRGTFEETEIMNPMSYTKNNFVEIFGKNGKYILPIKQEVEIISEKTQAGHNFVNLLYVGSGAEQFKKDEEMNKKLGDINFAIGNIEDSLSDKKLVKGVEIINTKEKNAQAEIGGYIRFTTECLKESNSKQLTNTVEHEIIHRHFMESNLGENKGLREYFADLRGYNGELKDDILKKGKVEEIFVDFYGANKNENFFRFIEESNYFMMGGGHTTADIEEFICSLTHSLIYSDKIEENLSRLVQEKDQSSGEREKTDILNNYEGSIAAMIKASHSKKEKEFLEKKMVEILNLKDKLQ